MSNRRYRSGVDRSKVKEKDTSREAAQRRRQSQSRISRATAKSHDPIQNRRFFRGGSQASASGNQSFRPVQISESQRQANESFVENFYRNKARLSPATPEKFDPRNKSFSGRVAQSVAEDKAPAQSFQTLGSRGLSGAYEGERVIDPGGTTPLKQGRPGFFERSNIDRNDPNVTTFEGAVPSGAALGRLISGSAAGKTAQSYIQKLIKPGSVPSNTGARNTAALIPKNTKFKAMVDSIARKWVGNKNVITHTYPSGATRDVIVSKSGAIVSVGAMIAAATAIILSSTGSGGASQHNILESAGGLSAVAYAAHDSGNTELLRDAANGILEITDLSAGDQAAMHTPAGMTYTATKYNIPVARDIANYYLMLADDIDAKSNMGLSDNEVWDARMEQRNLDEMKVAAYQQELNAHYLKMKAAAESKGRAEEARYYDAQLKKRASFEDEERRKNLEYWDEYFRLSAKYRDGASPSKLGFGIL